jgi:hypothetical protein
MHKPPVTKYSLLFGLLILLCLLPFAASAAKKPPKPPAPSAPVVPFTFEKPANWTLSQTGECDTLTLFLQNPAEPLQQLFFFPRFGPVYMTQEQKSSDMQYETISGQSLYRLDMPVIQPLNPENFARFIPQVLQMKNMREFMPDRPGLRVVEPVAVYPQKKALDYLDTQTAIIRILFVQNNRLGEGLIAITTVPSPEYRNAPGGGIGMGYLLYGLTAPKGELTARLPALLAASRSFKLGAEYEKKCRKERAEDMPTLLQDGASLTPVMNAMATLWEKRQPTEDMTAEKMADSLRGMERLYLPATGEVYEFPTGFSAVYLGASGQYTIPGLLPLPDDPALWRKIPLNGTTAVTKKE